MLIDVIVNTLRGLATEGPGPYIDLFAGLRRKTPEEGFREAIATWEGGFQNFPEDVGNWIRMPDGTRKLLGTMRGVTPAALAHHRGVPIWHLTVDDIKSVTLEEATEIGLNHYYRAPGFDRLPYLPSTEVWVDFGWGSGPVRSIMFLQDLLGVASDGVIGPVTTQAYADYVRHWGVKTAVHMAHTIRKTFYEGISKPGTPNHKFRQGWFRRADYYLPSHEAWWSTWES